MESAIQIKHNKASSHCMLYDLYCGPHKGPGCSSCGKLDKYIRSFGGKLSALNILAVMY